MATAARRAVEDMRKGAAKQTAEATDSVKLSQRLAELEKENKLLKERVHALEQQLPAKPVQVPGVQSH